LPVLDATGAKHNIEISERILMLPTIPLSSGLPKPMSSLWVNPHQIVRMDWLSRAAALPGKSLAVALALLHLANRHKNATVVLSRRDLCRFSISPDAGIDSLTRLAHAGLILANRRRGRPPKVTLLDSKGQVMVLWLDNV
jgi:hypothetical protein